MVTPLTLTLLDVALAGAVTAQVQATQAVLNALGAFHVRPTVFTLVGQITVAGGGTTAKAWVQTSFDGGVTWMDIASFAFTTASAIRAYNLTAAAVTAIATPTDGTLADNTSVNGFLGPIFRVKLTTTGTYTGASSFKIWAMAA